MGNAEPGRRRRIITALIGCLVLGGVLVTILYFVVIMDGDVNNLPPEFLNFFDPSTPGSDQLTPDQVDKWQHSGGGLNLVVINALDPVWSPYFDTAISQWDNGYPDSLSLRTEMASAPNAQCEADLGLVVACNGNYGNTGWKGVAEVLKSSSGVILAVTCRMNDYYMASRNPDEMQYTMCHELGHAWGLQHTDENFNNRDLGNCLDYTNRPQNNKEPDQNNYAFLYGMYGLVPGAEPYNSPTVAPATGDATSSIENGATGQAPPSTGVSSSTEEVDNEQNGGEKAQDGKDRTLGDDTEHLPEWLMDAIREAREDQALTGRVELPGGYVLDINKLPA